MVERRRIERWIGAVLVPEVRVAGTLASAAPVVPSPEYLRRFPPAGVVVFGRTPAGAGEPGELLASVRASCAEAGADVPFACCDLEQGAGLHFAGGTRLPPALALASAARQDERGESAGLEWIRAAGALTASEARELGVELVLGPVADVNTRRDNPIIAVRSFGDEPRAAGARARAFLEGLHAGGSGGCAKHFPGHGDTAQDSHLELPRVDHSRERLREIELAPFRDLIGAGVDAVMVAHLDVPALTEEAGLPATLSPRAVDGLLRTELDFRGTVLTDAMNMGALAREAERYVRALQAGCDGLLCPHDPLAAAGELFGAVERGRLEPSTLERAATSMRALRERLLARRPPKETGQETGRGPLARSGRTCSERSALARELAARSLVLPDDGWPWQAGEDFELAEPPFEFDSPEWVRTLEREKSAERPGAKPRNVALFVACQVAAWKGRYGLDGGELRALERRLALLRAEDRRVGLVWFASPDVLPEALLSRAGAPALVAFAPTPPMIAAACAFLRGELTRTRNERGG